MHFKMYGKQLKEHYEKKHLGQYQSTVIVPLLQLATYCKW